MALFDWFWRYRAWGWKAGLSIVDQGLFSGANFILNVLLARWLAPEDYGAFAIAFAVMLVFYQIQSSLILDPMSIMGPVYHTSNIFGYFKQQLKLHFLITIFMGLLLSGGILAVSKFFAIEKKILEVAVTMGWGLPFTLLPWFFRRVFYILQKPGISTIGSFTYFSGSILGLLFLNEISLLSSEWAVLLVAFSGFISSVAMCFFWDKRNIFMEENSLLTVLKQNWVVGGWLFASAGLVVFAGQAQIFLSGSLLGLEDAGAVRILQLFSQPMVLIVNAVGGLVLPLLSSAYGKGDMPGFKKLVHNLVAGLVALSTLYALFLFLFSGQIEFLLYQGKYAKYVPLIPFWGLIPLLLSINSGPSWGLQAAQRPYSLLMVSILWVITSATLGYIFILSWGVWGATLSAVIGYTIAVICYAGLYRLWIK